jgi:anaerobic selenocysteine-containing dehydrogenase
VGNPGDRAADAQRETGERALRVVRLIATRSGDTDRGPMIVMHPEDAKSRLLNDGELAWVYGPRRHELATVRIDEAGRVGEVVLRDIIGASPSEIVRVVRPDRDARGRRPPSLR